MYKNIFFLFFVSQTIQNVWRPYGVLRDYNRSDDDSVVHAPCIVSSQDDYHLLFHLCDV